MELKTFIEKLNTQPKSVDFEQTMAVIDANYEFSPTSFTNGQTHNEAGQNSGSCKIFAFGLLNELDAEATLACFGRFYRDDVLGNPEGNDHANIRNFMESGWGGVKFDSPALTVK
ncbi:HopJ type III effector protein [Vibrio atypicus]|uniref:HopJ type III effector protein n=1 Tax=Vibrio atypicus TaxID=558271 RepID=UPI00135B0755|nr:HopJ type III effector protein [Vibrio atypicus]